MHSAFLGEFLGTMIMILLGNGVVANVVLRQTKGEKSGWIVITTGWCFAVMAGVFTSLAIGSDGHLNPAVTVGVAVSSGDWSRLSVYVPAQILGAMAGALLVWLAYLHHWEKTPEPQDKLACFSTIPAIRAPLANIAHRAHRNLRTGAGGRRHFLEIRHRRGLEPRPWALPGRLSGVGNRPIAGRPHRLRHQSGARFRSAGHARDAAHFREGYIRLRLRLRSHHRSANGCDSGRDLGEDDRHLAAAAR